MNILVTGGAGYIGSHMLLRLSQTEHHVTTLDNLSTGHRDAVTYGGFVYGDLADQALLDTLFREGHFDAVMHFAACIEVGESIAKPEKYYRNNVINTQNLLDAMVRHNVKKLIFSSTAAIYGEAQYLPIDEAHQKKPTHPYGRTKWMAEQLLEDYERAHSLKSISLRYFNAAGAAPNGSIGERHYPETHLIPLVLQAASGRKKDVTVYGTDYDTPDGSCIRDYIHVMDICEAHLLALKKLSNSGLSTAYNLGCASGHSVLEIIEMVQKQTGEAINVEFGTRRVGDPPRLEANATKIAQELQWQPAYSDLKTIIRDAWRWELTYPK